MIRRIEEEYQKDRTRHDSHVAQARLPLSLYFRQGREHFAY